VLTNTLVKYIRVSLRLPRSC